MKIERFEDNQPSRSKLPRYARNVVISQQAAENQHASRLSGIEAWQLTRELTRSVYHLTKMPAFAHDFGLKRQIQEAAGSAMHNIAEGFDSETNAEFVRFLRYAKRSCTEVQSELYVALDEAYISMSEFQDAYEQARRARAAIRGFINYLKKYETSKLTP